MAIEKYIIDKSDVATLLRGEDLAIQPKGNIKGFCVEIAGNLTNGDVIKAMFPSMNIQERNNITLDIRGKTVEFTGMALREWWNAPYKAESEE